MDLSTSFYCSPLKILKGLWLFPFAHSSANPSLSSTYRTASYSDPMLCTKQTAGKPQQSERKKLYAPLSDLLWPYNANAGMPDWGLLFPAYFGTLAGVFVTLEAPGESLNHSFSSLFTIRVFWALVRQVYTQRSARSDDTWLPCAFSFPCRAAAAVYVIFTFLFWVKTKFRFFQVQPSWGMHSKFICSKHLSKLSVMQVFVPRRHCIFACLCGKWWLQPITCHELLLLMCCI